MGDCMLSVVSYGLVEIRRSPRVSLGLKFDTLRDATRWRQKNEGNDQPCWYAVGIIFDRLVDRYLRQLNVIAKG
jgi:hypothetical protein